MRSKPELIKLLGDTVDLSTFDYSTGTMNSTLIKPRGRCQALPFPTYPTIPYNTTPYHTRQKYP